jgi:hypothetical protein
MISAETYKWAVEPIIRTPEFNLVPLLYWYDSTHIASVEYYNSFVFHPKRHLKRGGFIEDELG